MSARANNPVLFTSHVVFPGGNASEQPTPRSDTVEIRRLLLRRLEALEAALLMLAELLGTAATAPRQTREE